MKSQKIFCKRSEDIILVITAIQESLQGVLDHQSNPSVNQLSTVKNKELQLQNKQINQYDLVVKNLAAVNKIKRPKSEGSLKNQIKSLLGLKDLTPVVNKIYQQLISNKKISLDQSKKIIYDF